MVICQISTDPIGRCSAIPCQLMPAPQYNEGANNGCDDAGSLTRAIQVNRAAEKSRHDTSDNSQYSRQDEALRVVGGRRNPSGDEACDSPYDDCPDDLHACLHPIGSMNFRDRASHPKYPLGYCRSFGQSAQLGPRLGDRNAQHHIDF